MERFDPEGLRRTFAESPFRAIYSASIASQYGARGDVDFASRDAKSSADTGVSLIIRRDRDDSFLRGAEYRGHMREHHVLILVGLPATEITGMVVSAKATETLEMAKAEIVKNGFYIPIYDLEGKLMFMPQEYDAQISK